MSNERSLQTLAFPADADAHMLWPRHFVTQGPWCPEYGPVMFDRAACRRVPRTPLALPSHFPRAQAVIYARRRRLSMYAPTRRLRLANLDSVSAHATDDR